MSLRRASKTHSVNHQARHVRRMHIAFATFLMVATLGLAATTSMGTQLFQDDKHASSSSRATSFNHVNEDAPLPIIMNQERSTTATVKVQGEVLSKSGTSAPRYVSPSTTLTDRYVRSFAFGTSPTSNGIVVYATWNTQINKGPFLYIVRESRTNTPSENDTTVYSVEGSNLNTSTQTFDVDQLNGDLYVSVYKLNDQGMYDLMGASPVVSASNG